MELWVRSQDKLKLVKVNYFYIMEHDSYCTIVGETIDSGPTIARYNSKERALEVLDEIQDLLEGKIHEEHINKFDIFNGDERKVYRMPKE